MRLHRKGVIGAMFAVVAVLAAACSSGGGTKTSSNTTTGASTTATTAVHESITVASFNFGESEILANMYKDVLQKAGNTVTLRDKLGAREVVEPALQGGQIDLVPEYVGTVLEFLNKNAGEASSMNGEVPMSITGAKSRTGS